MKVNRSNYEAFFLDYHEGNLNDTLKKELFLFLESNPDLKEEFESFEIITVSPSGKKFSDKDSLKRDTITVYNYKTWFIGYVENDLSSEEKKEVELFLQKNPSLKPELEIFKQTKLVPDHRIIFENKKQLKHGGKVISLTPQFYRVAVAASVALLLIAYFFLRNNEVKEVVQESPKMEMQNEEPVLAPEKSLADINKDEIKKEEIRKEERPQNFAERKNAVKTHPSVKDEIPVNENKTNEPLLAHKEEPLHQNITEKKDSSENLFAENKKSGPFKPTSSDLSKVFSDDELKELGITKDVQQKEKASLWDLASKGINEIGKATGTEMSLKKGSNEIDETETLALSVGKFSVSHTSGK